MEKKQQIKLFAYIFIIFSVCLSASLILADNTLVENATRNTALHNAVDKLKEREGACQARLHQDEIDMLAIRDSFFFNEYLYNKLNKQELEDVFYTYAASHPFVSSVRFIDKDGQEQIKVIRFSRQPKNLDTVKPSKLYKISQYELKDRSHESYFLESKKRAKNEVWFSHIDLNIDDNRMQKVYSPTMKAVLPVKYRNEFAGVFIIDFMVFAYIEDVVNVPLFDSILFNNKGDILYHYTQKACKGKRCISQYLGKNRNIADDFPQYAEQIMRDPVLITDHFVSARFSLPVNDGMNMLLLLNSEHLQQQQHLAYKRYIIATLVVSLLSLILSYIIIRLFRKKLANIDQLNRVHGFLKEASHVAKIGFWESNEHLPITWSSGAHVIFEIDNKDEPLSKERFKTFLTKEDYAELKRRFEYSIKHRTEYFFTHQIITAKNSIKYVETRGRHIFDSHGVYIKSIGSMHDVTQQKDYEDSLRAEKDNLETIFNTALEGICVLNLETKYEYFNKNYLNIVECTKEELRESNFYDWVTEEGRSKATKVFKELFRSGQPQYFERDYVTRDGTRKRLKSSVALMSDKRQILMTTVDNTRLYNAMQVIKEQSITDDLTHLYNRKAYQDKVDELLKENDRYASPFSMMMLDIDFFKSINDAYGHPVGDSVLIALSQLVKKRIRRCDFAYRIGGEEFIILLPNTKIDEAYAMAERLRISVAEDINVIDTRKITISIGLVEVDKDDSESSLFKRVDEQLYVAKRSGRNRVSVEKKH